MSTVGSSSADSGKERGVSLPAKVVVTLRAGALLALANVVCALIVAWAWTHVRAEPNVISVTGSAKKTIQSDLIVWTGRISVNNTDLAAGYDELKAAEAKSLGYLRDQNVPVESITVSAISTQKHYVRDEKGHDTDKVSSYELVQTVQISSSEVERVAEIARKVTELIKEGVLLESNAPQYHFTKLADLKISMLAEATKDATARAQQIAQNSGATLGAIREARMGVMQITPVHSNAVSDMGYSDTSSFEKEITAVVSAKFSLE
jgi:hypothetical protein